MKILVVGCAHEGKSTVANLVEKCLIAQGFMNIEVKDTLDDEERHLDESLRIWHQRKRIESLKNKQLKIIIETVPTQKDGYRCYDKDDE